MRGAQAVGSSVLLVFELMEICDLIRELPGPLKCGMCDWESGFAGFLRPGAGPRPIAGGAAPILWSRFTSLTMSLAALIRVVGLLVQNG